MNDLSLQAQCAGKQRRSLTLEEINPFFLKLPFLHFFLSLFVISTFVLWGNNNRQRYEHDHDHPSSLTKFLRQQPPLHLAKLYNCHFNYHRCTHEHNPFYKAWVMCFMWVWLYGTLHWNNNKKRFVFFSCTSSSFETTKLVRWNFKRGSWSSPWTSGKTRQEKGKNKFQKWNKF